MWMSIKSIITPLNEDVVHGIKCINTHTTGILSNLIKHPIKLFINLDSTWPLPAAQFIHLISNHVIGMASHVCKLRPPGLTLFINPKLIKGNKSTCYFHLLNHSNCWKVWPILRGTFDSNETVKCIAPIWIRH